MIANENKGEPRKRKENTQRATKESRGKQRKATENKQKISPSKEPTSLPYLQIFKVPVLYNKKQKIECHLPSIKRRLSADSISTINFS